ncbi:MAG: hypothetical protein ABL904_09765 [Hyphomicrobiaceae bacterium]
MTAVDWSVVFQAVGGIGAMLIAIIAYVHSRRTFQLQAITLYVSNWRELSRLYLENDRAAGAFAKLSGKSAAQTDDVNFLIFMYINQALLAYYSWRFGALPRHEMIDEFRAIWQIIAAHQDRAKHFLHVESYPIGFVKLFESVAEKAVSGGVARWRV